MYEADETLCPKCGGKTKVTHTYKRETEIERRRECPKCFEPFATRQPRPKKEKRVKVAQASAAKRRLIRKTDRDANQRKRPASHN